MDGQGLGRLRHGFQIGDAHGVVAFDGENGHEAWLRTGIASADREPRFRARFYLHLAVLFEFVQRQVADFSITGRVQIPAIFLEGFDQHVAKRKPELPRLEIAFMDVASNG